MKKVLVLSIGIVFSGTGVFAGEITCYSNGVQIYHNSGNINATIADSGITYISSSDAATPNKLLAQISAAAACVWIP